MVTKAPHVKVYSRVPSFTPQYSTDEAAGMDIKALIEEEVILMFAEKYPNGISKNGSNLNDRLVLKPNERALVKTGLFVEIPVGYEIQIRPRSGFALKKGVTVINSPGTIDSDYRGEIGVILINHSTESVIINHGDRIAQMVLSKVEKIRWEVFGSPEKLKKSNRQNGGFGSTGK